MELDKKKIRRWYKEVLSGFTVAKEFELHKFDVIIKNASTKRNRTILVPLCLSDNIGEDMCIDEKMIGEEFYTIISNRQTHKIAFMANTTNSSDLLIATNPIKSELKQVKILNRDLASSYRKFSNIAMPSADQVGDKFHVIKLSMDACQFVRIEQKKKILTDKRKAHKAFKERENQRKEECKKENIKFKREKFHYKEKRLSNNETPSEALGRSRFLLFKYPHQWTKKQSTRAIELFSEFPVIDKAYRLIIDFREWYAKKNIGKCLISLERRLHKWYEDVEDSGVTEIMNFSSTVERNEESIINYFRHNGASNAMAENRNGKIKKFINLNQGARDKDFFFFRLIKYFS